MGRAPRLNRPSIRILPCTRIGALPVFLRRKERSPARNGTVRPVPVVVLFSGHANCTQGFPCSGRGPLSFLQRKAERPLLGYGAQPLGTFPQVQLDLEVCVEAMCANSTPEHGFTPAFPKDNQGQMLLLDFAPVYEVISLTCALVV